MQDTPTLVIGYGVEQILRVLVAIANGGWIRFARGRQVRREVLGVEPVGIVAAVRVFPPEVFAIIGKAFVEYDIAPGCAGHQIAEPVVDQFMRDHIFVVVVELLSWVLLDASAVHDRGGVFHGATDVLVYANLRVLFPDEGVSEFFREEVEHFRCLSEDAAGIRRVGGIGIVAQFDVVPPFPRNRPTPDADHREVGGRREALLPVIGACSVSVQLLRE